MLPIITQMARDAGRAAIQGARYAPTSLSRHLGSIHALCEEVGRPFDEVAAMYQCELARLTASASVSDYLPVLVVKHIRDIYRHRRDALHHDEGAG